MRRRLGKVEAEGMVGMKEGMERRMVAERKDRETM